MIIETETPQKAWQGSQAANRGEEVTVSVLQSGVAVNVTKRDRQTSIVVNISDRSIKTLIEANTQEYTLSPERDWLACLETVDIRQPQAHLPLSLELAFRYAVKLISLQNQSQKRLEVSNDVLADSLCWASNSEQLAFIGYESERDLKAMRKRNRPPQIYIYNCRDNTVQTWAHLQNLAESGQGAMGNPLWKDLGRYLRNSPIFAVDRVQTPLMIIQGDMDYVLIEQGEEFFASLYRQGKRADFVRYWGEGHVLASPANIKDMWRRIFAWFN